MSTPPTMANGHPPGHSSKTSKTPPSPEPRTTESAKTTQDIAYEPSPAQQNAAPSPKPPSRPKPKRLNYAQIHSKPLPLTTHPLPAFHPSNPISLLRLTYIYLSHLLSPPSSHPETLYTGLFSPRTRSVHITDPAQVRALWEMGFFGKGTLSRSEPSWMEREGARRKAEGGVGESGGAEAATARRREERRFFKLERARVERERVLRQRAVEEGRLSAEEASAIEAVVAKGAVEAGGEKALGERNIAPSPLPNGDAAHKDLHEGRVPDADLLQATSPKTPSTAPRAQSSASAPPAASTSPSDDTAPPDGTPPLPNQEHLQLTLEESFYLTYALGALAIYPPPPSLSPTPFAPLPPTQPYTTQDLLFLSCHHSTFPSALSGAGIAPDDPFLLNYATYHHFRSLGWVVRSGLKFGCDYLLYNRGPVFSHAEFAVLIAPSYTHRYWNTPAGRALRRIPAPADAGFSTAEEDGGDGSSAQGGGGGGRDWWSLHAINRVQAAVRKSLVLCYVNVPSPWEVGLDDEWDREVDVGRLLRGYGLREFVVRRWVVNRSRD